MACLELSIPSNNYSCLTEKDKNKRRPSDCSIIFHFNYFFVLYVAFSKQMATFIWVTFSDIQATFLQPLLYLPKHPILIHSSYMSSFYTMSIPINTCAPKISHNLNLNYIIYMNHWYLPEDIIVFFIFYSIQFITHLLVIQKSVLSMTHFISFFPVLQSV